MIGVKYHVPLAVDGGTGVIEGRYVGATASGAPASGTWALADFVVTQDGHVFICTSGGTPGTWIDASASGGSTPTGAAGGALDGSYPNPGLAASVAGSGLSESSDVLAVNVDGSTLEISSDSLRVKDSGVTEAKLGLTDVTTANASTSAHGLLKKLDNNAAHYMDGQGNWSTPSGSGGVASDSIWDAAGDLAVGTGADTAARLALGSSGKVLRSNGSTATWEYPLGYEYDYVTRNTDLTVSATTAAGASSWITGNSVSYDGSTRVLIECFSMLVTPSGGDTIVTLWEDSTDLGRIAQVSGAGAAGIHGMWFRTPSNASHTYTVKAYRATANGTIYGSLGAVAFLRITKA